MGLKRRSEGHSRSMRDFGTPISFIPPPFKAKSQSSFGAHRPPFKREAPIHSPPPPLSYDHDNSSGSGSNGSEDFDEFLDCRPLVIEDSPIRHIHGADDDTRESSLPKPTPEWVLEAGLIYLLILLAIGSRRVLPLKLIPFVPLRRLLGIARKWMRYLEGDVRRLFHPLFALRKKVTNEVQLSTRGTNARRRSEAIGMVKYYVAGSYWANKVNTSMVNSRKSTTAELSRDANSHREKTKTAFPGHTTER